MAFDAFGYKFNLNIKLVLEAASSPPPKKKKKKKFKARYSIFRSFYKFEMENEFP